MTGRLDVIGQVDDSVLGPLDWWVAASRWPSSKWFDDGSLGSFYDVAVVDRNSDINGRIGEGAAGVVGARDVVVERSDWARELVREVSLGEDEDSVVVSDAGIGVDEVGVNVSVDSDGWTAGRELHFHS